MYRLRSRKGGPSRVMAGPSSSRIEGCLSGLGVLANMYPMCRGREVYMKCTRLIICLRASYCGRIFYVSFGMVGR